MSADTPTIRAPRPVTPASILAARLDDLAARADHLDVDPGLRADLHAAARLAGGLDGYLERCASPESPARRELARRTAGHDWDRGHRTPGLEQEMLSGNVEAQTLALLAHVTGARRVLEIGMFTGYATLALAEALPEDGVVVTCELDPTVADFARDCFAGSGPGNRIDVRTGPAADTLASLATAGETFDLVFVDADKGGYLDYVDAVLDTGLLAERGLLCVDNTLMQGEPWTGVTSANGAAISRFNDALAADPRVRQVIVPLRDGLTLACRAWGDVT